VRAPVERAAVRETRGSARDSGMRVVPAAASDFNVYDRPTHQRQRMAVNSDIRPDTTAEELLDIPAFLRRQAD
jgi:3-deoxy-D-manno-octulosonic acid (KDO) 8-phosphate synthase